MLLSGNGLWQVDCKCRVHDLMQVVLPPTLRADSTAFGFNTALGACAPIGFFLRANDDIFIRAILRIPLESIASTAAMVRVTRCRAPIHQLALR